MDITVENVKKVYGKDKNIFSALNGLSCHIKSGEFVCIMGESGSGKSTLLNLMAGFDNATSGKISIGDTVITELSESDRAKFRRDNIGFIFQSFCLINELSALENVMMPLLIKGINEKQAKQMAVNAYYNG